MAIHYLRAPQCICMESEYVNTAMRKTRSRRTDIPVPIPYATYITAGLEDFGLEAEFAKAMKRVKPAEASANDNDVAFFHVCRTHDNS